MTPEEVKRLAELGEYAWKALLRYAGFISPQTKALATEFRALFLKAVAELQR